MIDKIQLLDCTLRDGGLGLEDAYINKLSERMFENDDYHKIIDCLCESNIDIVELGSIESSERDKTGFGIFQNVEEVSKMIPVNRNENQMYVALFRGPDTPIEDIPNWNPSLVDGLRVIIRYSELEKSLAFCAGLAVKGYKVFVQPMLTMRYNNDELDLIIRESNSMGAYALYFVDSYGYMQASDVLRFVEKYNKSLNPNIKMGFHAHNNMNMAYSNVLTFITANINREIIIDSCAVGMGQGAGNLQTELIVPYLNRITLKYNYSAILDMCEIVDKYSLEGAWGYSVTRLLPAIYNTAYKYAIVMRKIYRLSYSQIEEILKNMPDNFRHRYTKENVQQLLTNMNKENS